MSNSVFADPEIKKKVVIIGSLCLLMLAIEIVNSFIDHSLNYYGMVPRDPYRLFGIFTSPFLHGNMDHLISNLGPFAALSGFIIWNGIKEYIKISLLIMIFTGLLVWSFAPVAIIVGSSGVVFGYLGYLIGRAFFQKNQNDVIIAVVVLFVYGGMVFGVFPGTPGVSWESHLFGLISGIGIAWLWRKK